MAWTDGQTPTGRIRGIHTWEPVKVLFEIYDYLSNGTVTPTLLKKTAGGTSQINSADSTDLNGTILSKTTLANIRGAISNLFGLASGTLNGGLSDNDKDHRIFPVKTSTGNRYSGLSDLLNDAIGQSNWTDPLPTQIRNVHMSEVKQVLEKLTRFEFEFGYEPSSESGVIERKATKSTSLTSQTGTWFTAAHDQDSTGGYTVSDSVNTPARGPLVVPIHLHRVYETAAGSGIASYDLTQLFEEYGTSALGYGSYLSSIQEANFHLYEQSKVAVFYTSEWTNNALTYEFRKVSDWGTLSVGDWDFGTGTLLGSGTIAALSGTAEEDSIETEISVSTAEIPTASNLFCFIRSQSPESDQFNNELFEVPGGDLRPLSIDLGVFEICRIGLASLSLRVQANLSLSYP